MPPITFNLYLHDVPADADVEINLHVYNVSTDPEVQAAIDASAARLKVPNDALEASLKEHAAKAPA